MLNKQIKKYSNLNVYYNELLSINNIHRNNIYEIGYPIFYKEVNFFWLNGKIIKIINRNSNLNKILHFKSSVNRIKFVITIPINIPYLQI